MKQPAFGQIGLMANMRIITGVLLLVSMSIQAAALKLPALKVGPVTYNDVTVVGANVTDLYFVHAEGIGNVKLKYLSAEMQKRFQYNSTVAAAAEKRQMEADTLYQSLVLSNMAYQAKAQAGVANRTNVVESLADPISEKSLLGKAAPALDLEKWTGDKPDTDGKYVLIDFWAPWSAASTRCIPELNALQKKLSKNLVIIGVTPTDELEGSPKMEFVCAIDAKAKLSAAAGVTSLPSVLLVDPKGIVRYQGHPAAITEKNLERLFAASAE